MGFLFDMAKDPAFLFYASDFLTGTMFMTNEQVGLYIRMLCAQHQHGGRIDTNVLRTQCDSITNGDTVFAKFQHDALGSFNIRLQSEMDKRKEKSVKAAESVRIRWEKQKEKHAYDSNTNVLRSEDINVNENESIIKTEKKEKPKKISTFTPPTLDEVKQYVSDNGYKPEFGKKIFDYYSVAEWKDAEGKPVKSWKQKIQGVWFKPNNDGYKAQTSESKFKIFG